MTAKKPTVTLLDIVRAVQDFASSDREVVAVLTHLVRTRKIVWSGA